MDTFFQILGIIGIILLCIIGFIFVVLFVLLFVPLRYKVKVQKDSKLTAQIQATWLLHFIKLHYSYPEPGKLFINVCGFKIWESDNEEQIEESEPETIRKKEKEAFEQESINQTEEKIEEDISLGTGGNEDSNNNAQSKVEDKNREKQNIFQKIQYKIKSIYDKIKKILLNLKYYKNVLEEKESRLLFEHCKMRIFKILKHIKPKVFKADILFGTGEPDTTGYVLAVYSMFHPLFEGQIDVTPDFEQKILEGRMYLKGRITVINLLYNGARIYFDKRLHVLLNKLDRKDI